MSVRRIAVAATLLAGGVAPLLASGGPGGAVGPVGSAGAVADAAAPAPSLCAPPADTVAPVVTSVTFGTASIDLDSGSRVQTVTATAADVSGNGAPSGVAQVTLGVQGSQFFDEATLTRTSGTAADGTWSGQFTVSKYAHPGTYSIETLTVTDAAGNEQGYSGGRSADGPSALSLHPADDPTFAVTGTPAARRKPPVDPLRAFTLRPAAVNTTAAGRRVHVTARLAGPAPTQVSVQLNSTEPATTRFVNLNASLRRSGGTWSGTVRVPRWIGRQTLRPSVFVGYGDSFQPRQRSYDTQRLHHLGLPARLPVVSGVDATPPTLKSLSFSPGSIDSTDGAEQVTVTATAADTGSGVQYVYVDSDISNGANGSASGDYPFAAAGVGYLSSDKLYVRLTRAANGSFTGTVTVPQCVPSGTYQLDVDVADVAGNDAYYSTAKLAAAGILATIDVTSRHGDVVAPYVYSAATYGADSELFLNFSEGVTHVNTSTLAVYPLAPARTRYAAPAAVSSITCANGSATVDCSGADGLVTSAVLTVPGLEPGGLYDVYANLNQVTPQLTDGNGNPLAWDYAATEVKDS